VLFPISYLVSATSKSTAIWACSLSSDPRIFDSKAASIGEYGRIRFRKPLHT